MKKVILHNMTLKGIENVPGVLDYDQRGIILAEEEDVVITRSKIDGNYLHYLGNLGYPIGKIHFLNSNASTWNSVFSNNKVISNIKENHSGVILDTYHVTELEAEFATKTDTTLYGNNTLSDKYGTKSGFRKLCKDLELPIAEGFEGLNSFEDIDKAINSIGKISSLVLLRLDEGVSGAGNQLLEYSEYKKLSDLERKGLITEILNKLPQRRSSSGITVEQWIENVVSSPSLQFQVLLNGEIILSSTHDQILEGKEKWYIGCRYPADKSNHKLWTKIIEQGFRFMMKLKEEGFIGYCGLDLIITKDNHFYYVEANVRKPGTTYPREFCKKVYKGLDDIKYVARDIQSKKLVGTQFKTLLEMFSDITVKYPKDGEGILIYNVGALEEGGRFDIVLVYRDEANRDKMIKEINSKLSL